MKLPGFTAEESIYTSSTHYATGSTAHGAKGERVVLARINDRAGSGAGYDTDKPHRADPFAWYQPGNESSGTSLGSLISDAVDIIRGTVGTPWMAVCALTGRKAVLRPDGSWTCA